MFSEKTNTDLCSTVPDSITSKRKSESSELNSKRTKRVHTDVNRGFKEAIFDETEYFFENNLRKVYPYYFTYTTFCKGRWVGKRLIDVFSTEFRAHSKEEYEKNILSGNIKINGESITCDYVFKENDCVTNKAHRHEIGVVASPIKIIQCTNDLIVIDKPPSIPIHPCGRYRYNCLLFILAKEHSLNKLYSVHRLDRLTSGLIVFAKTIQKSQEINKLIRERKVKKQYVCRVEGNFPDGEICCNEPIEVISPKMGICMTSPSGKECSTKFKKSSYNGKSSIVLCEPLTGRMHQIRVHLQFLGYPIINDPIYNHPHAFGPLKGKNGEIGKSKDQLLEDLLKTHNLQKWLLEDYALLKEENAENKKTILREDNRVSLHALEYYTKSDGYEELANKYVKDDKKIIFDDACDLCHQKYMDPEPKDLLLFLHSLKYSCDNWEFQSELPVWAKDDWNEN